MVRLSSECWGAGAMGEEELGLLRICSGEPGAGLVRGFEAEEMGGAVGSVLV